MREPAFHMPDVQRVPFSVAPDEWLRDVVSSASPVLEAEDLVGKADGDFGRRYAAIILVERQG